MAAVYSLILMGANLRVSSNGFFVGLGLQCELYCVTVGLGPALQPHNEPSLLPQQPNNELLPELNPAPIFLLLFFLKRT